MSANHTDLKKFAQSARRQLREQVASRLEQVLKTDSAALREREAARRELVQQIAVTSKKTVIDRVAYTWFNRFCALRFMDANHYNRIGVVSPAEGFTQPEILQEAKGGYIDDDLHKFVDSAAVFDLLNGRRPSADPQQEAYRLLLVGTCNALNRAMPFLFEPIADYTELLMPQDLLSQHAILHELRAALTVEACHDVEVIGWLYQFYISERKDEVFEALKQNQKIAPEDIPAATQLFTPHWIVRYLVENSLGRLWMLNRPNSRLVEKMDYYIKPEEPETDFLRVDSPEEIKVCDPACGSGHMLTYAFDLLHAIYEEEGYPASEIPRLILEKNLYGIEIDERAGDLAAFALAMKARGRDRRFFSYLIQPQICVIENITFAEQELKEYAAVMGRDLFTEPFLQTLMQFEHAKNFGSLISPSLSDTIFLRAELERKGLGGNLFLYDVHKRVMRVFSQIDYLTPKYHVVVANPPYMGGSGFNEEIREFAKDYYPNSKADVFAMFIERGLELIRDQCYCAMVTMESWMFLSSYEELRSTILENDIILSMVHMPYLGKGGTSMGINFGTSATILQKSRNNKAKGTYICVRYYETDDNGVPYTFPVQNERLSMTSAEDLKKIQSAPIAYWVSEYERSLYSKNELLGGVAFPKKGLDTGENEIFLRLWHEISIRNVCFDNLNYDRKWFPYNKGGNFRKWYGNREYLINWFDDGKEIKSRLSWSSKKPTIRNASYYFREGFTWTTVSSGGFSSRFCPPGALFDNGGCTLFTNKEYFWVIGSFLNCKLTSRYLEFLSPTLNFQPGDIAKILFPKNCLKVINETGLHCSRIAKEDWDSYETSWDFQCPMLLKLDSSCALLKDRYDSVCEYTKNNTLSIQQLEEENNRIYIQAFGLQDKVIPSVPLEEITLTCNPYYRYGGKRSESDLYNLLLADTMREFMSYAVGCMFGRYSLDKPGLILANQGETLQDYLRQVPDPTFLPDEDNAIPVLEGEWFSDDITERFKKFLRVTFGAQHYEENLAFIENAIGRDVRSYFLKEFYSQHVRMYQKRPIYWLFSSPKGSFNVLIYMHRYKPDTLSVILNRYLREFRAKLEGRKAHLEQVSISASTTAREKTAALKEIEKLNKTLEELRVYEREILYPLAVQGIEIDLDDGVKVNYQKFGKALSVTK